MSTLSVAGIRDLSRSITRLKAGRMQIRKGVKDDLKHFCLLIVKNGVLSGHLSGPGRGAKYTIDATGAEIVIEPPQSGYGAGYTREMAYRDVRDAITSAMEDVATPIGGMSTKGWLGFYLIRLADGKSIGKPGLANMALAVAGGIISQEFADVAIENRFTMMHKR